MMVSSSNDRQRFAPFTAWRTPAAGGSEGVDSRLEGVDSPPGGPRQPAAAYTTGVGIVWTSRGGYAYLPGGGYVYLSRGDVGRHHGKGGGVLNETRRGYAYLPRGDVGGHHGEGGDIGGLHGQGGVVREEVLKVLLKGLVLAQRRRRQHLLRNRALTRLRRAVLEEVIGSTSPHRLVRCWPRAWLLGAVLKWILSLSGPVIRPMGPVTIRAGD
eukprot:222925-Pyramimonas_sp.AAC.1